MPRTLTPQQTPSGSPSAPGSTTIPVPLVDQVTVGSITPMTQAAINNAAYLAALLLGPTNAPPNAQPPALATTGLGSGPSRKQTLPAGPVSLGQLSTLNGTPLQVVNIPGVGEYVYISPYLVPAWANSTSYTAGQFVTNNGAIYQCTTGGTSAPIGSGTGPNGPGWGITDGTNGLLWASITFAGGDGTDYVQTATPSDWTATKAYVAGQYVLDPAHTSNIWLCIAAGTSGSGSGSPATPFTNATPTTGVSTQADGSGALLWASVAFVGQWISLNALRKGFPANVASNVGILATGESFQPQFQGLVQTDWGSSIPLPYLPLTASQWVEGTTYHVGDRVFTQVYIGGLFGYRYCLLVCTTAGKSGSSTPSGSQLTIVTDGSTNGLQWLVVFETEGNSPPQAFPKQLAYTEGGTTAAPGTIPPAQLPVATGSKAGILPANSGIAVAWGYLELEGGSINEEGGTGYEATLSGGSLTITGSWSGNAAFIANLDGTPPGPDAVSFIVAAYPGVQAGTITIAFYGSGGDSITPGSILTQFTFTVIDAP